MLHVDLERYIVQLILYFYQLYWINYYQLKQNLFYLYLLKYINSVKILIQTFRIYRLVFPIFCQQQYNQILVLVIRFQLIPLIYLQIFLLILCKQFPRCPPRILYLQKVYSQVLQKNLVLLNLHLSHSHYILVN